MAIQPVLGARAALLEALWQLDTRQPDTTTRLDRAIAAYGIDNSPAAHDARA